MKILVFNWKDRSHPAAGGAELFTEEVLRRWADGDDDVTLFTSAVSDAPSEENRDGIRIVRRGSRFGVYAAARRFYMTEPIGYDLVIDEINTRPFGCARWVKDAPVLGFAHQVAREIWFEEFPVPIAILGRYWLEPLWLRAYRDVPVVTVSESSRESLMAYGVRDVSVVPVGLSLPRDLPVVSKETSPTILFLGRLAGNKRPEEALAAFALLRQRVSHAQMWVVGTGALEQDMKRGAPPGVHFFGHVGESQKFELMARASVLAITSRREGWGLTVDEAAAVGTHTIGYDVPGLRDSIRAAGGQLVDPNPSSLADALERYVATDRRTTSSGWTGGARSWDEVAHAFRSQAQRAADLAPRLARRRYHAPRRREA